MDHKISPIHPGAILMDEFLVPMGVTQNRMAVAIGVPPVVDLANPLPVTRWAGLV